MTKDEKIKELRTERAKTIKLCNRIAKYPATGREIIIFNRATRIIALVMRIRSLKAHEQMIIATPLHRDGVMSVPVIATREKHEDEIRVTPKPIMIKQK